MKKIARKHFTQTFVLTLKNATSQIVSNFDFVREETNQLKYHNLISADMLIATDRTNQKQVCQNRIVLFDTIAARHAALAPIG